MAPNPTVSEAIKESGLAALGRESTPEPETGARKSVGTSLVTMCLIL